MNHTFLLDDFGHAIPYWEPKPGIFCPCDAFSQEDALAFADTVGRTEMIE